MKAVKAGLMEENGGLRGDEMARLKAELTVWLTDKFL
jgi:hypothetical protein